MSETVQTPKMSKHRVRKNLFVRTTKSLSSLASPFKSPKRGKGKTSQSSPGVPSSKAVLSLGVGSVSPDGNSVSFTPSPTKESGKSRPLLHNFSTCSSSEAETTDSTTTSDVVFVRDRSCFMRVADLDMVDDSVFCDDPAVGVGIADELRSQSNYHHASVQPPSGVPHDPNELWVALNDGCEVDSSRHNATPIAPVAVKKLVKFGLQTALDQSMWIPDSKSVKLGRQEAWVGDTFQENGSIRLKDPKNVTDVMIWSGSFKHNFFGSDLPAIRAAGFVNMSAKALMELLVDSSRVREYNQLSLGRNDLVIFQENMMQKGVFGHSITKVMKSETRPPLLRKTLVFVSLLHARELDDGSGYLLLTRAVEHPDEEEGNANVLKSEILIGVNVIRKVEGDENRCLMINVNHIRSPMVPTMIAKRIGVSAATNFIADIRAVGSK